MMIHNNLKLKLLYLVDVLRQETNEDTPLSTTNLIKKLSGCGITINRKTLYGDIELLKEYGMDIYTEKTAGSANLYNLASREFELAELKLLL